MVHQQPASAPARLSSEAAFSCSSGGSNGIGERALSTQQPRPLCAGLPIASCALWLATTVASAQKSCYCLRLRSELQSRSLSHKASLVFGSLSFPYTDGAQQAGGHMVKHSVVTIDDSPISRTDHVKQQPVELLVNKAQVVYLLGGGAWQHYGNVTTIAVRWDAAHSVRQLRSKHLCVCLVGMRQSCIVTATSCSEPLSDRPRQCRGRRAAAFAQHELLPMRPGGTSRAAVPPLLPPHLCRAPLGGCQPWRMWLSSRCSAHPARWHSTPSYQTTSMGGGKLCSTSETADCARLCPTTLPHFRLPVHHSPGLQQCMAGAGQGTAFL